MKRGEPRLTERMQARIQEILVADGIADTQALAEAQSLCEGLGYYQRVTGSTGIHFSRGYEAIEVRGDRGDLIESIPFEPKRIEEFF